MSLLVPLLPAAHLETALAAAGRQLPATARTAGANSPCLPSLGRAGSAPLHVGPAPAQLDIAGMEQAFVAALCTEDE